MPTYPRKLRRKVDFNNPDRAGDYATLAEAKELTRLHRYTVKETVNGQTVWKQVTKHELNKRNQN